MKIIIAPDKYKGNMTSPELCEIIRNEFLAEMPDAEIISVPLADGGDGTTEALTAAHHGELRKITVSGPLGAPAEAVFGVFDSGRSAVLEMAAASGLALLKNTALNPLRAHTFGTGELIRAALDCGAGSLTIGIGGSATVDGGISDSSITMSFTVSTRVPSPPEAPSGGVSSSTAAPFPPDAVEMPSSVRTFVSGAVSAEGSDSSVLADPMRKAVSSSGVSGLPTSDRR